MQNFKMAVTKEDGGWGPSKRFDGFEKSFVALSLQIDGRKGELYLPLSREAAEYLHDTLGKRLGRRPLQEVA